MSQGVGSQNLYRSHQKCLDTNFFWQNCLRPKTFLDKHFFDQFFVTTIFLLNFLTTFFFTNLFLHLFFDQNYLKQIIFWTRLFPSKFSIIFLCQNLLTNQISLTKYPKQNAPNYTYQSNPFKPYRPNQTYQTIPTKPKPTKPNQIYKKNLPKWQN